MNDKFQGQKMENNMKIINLFMVMAAACLFATTAFAATTSVTGVIKSIDAPNDSITLVGGVTYTLGNEMEAETFKTGERVKIIFETKKGKIIASSVKAAK